MQRGIRGTDLFISIMSIGAFGFKLDGIKHGSYIEEKLNIHGIVDIDKLAELINGVLKELEKKEK